MTLQEGRRLPLKKIYVITVDKHPACNPYSSNFIPQAMATDKSVLKIEKQQGSIRCKVVNLLLSESGERCGTPHIFWTCI